MTAVLQSVDFACRQLSAQLLGDRFSDEVSVPLVPSAVSSGSATSSSGFFPAARGSSSTLVLFVRGDGRGSAKASALATTLGRCAPGTGLTLLLEAGEASASTACEGALRETVDDAHLFLYDAPVRICDRKMLGRAFSALKPRGQLKIEVPLDASEDTLFDIESEALFAGFVVDHWVGVANFKGTANCIQLCLRRPDLAAPLPLAKAFDFEFASAAPASTLTSSSSASSSTAQTAPSSERPCSVTAKNKFFISRRDKSIDEILSWRRTELRKFLKQVKKELANRDMKVCDPPKPGDKKKACANCSCGRADLEKTHGVDKANEMLRTGQLESKCGNCALGDDYRCDGCPFRGMPSFEPGEKLQLKESSQGETNILMTATTKGAEEKIDFSKSDL